jgi:hypothetical protein
MTMYGYVVRRILATLPVLGIVAVVVFAILHLSPGDPAALIAGDQATPQQIAEVRNKLGLDRPLYEQFAVWLSSLGSGDLGVFDLFQPAGDAPFGPAHGADHIADHHHDHRHGPARRADWRDRGLARRHLDRSRRDEFGRARLLAADFRGRLPVDLRPGHDLGCVSRTGLHAAAGGNWRPGPTTSCCRA